MTPPPRSCNRSSSQVEGVGQVAGGRRRIAGRARRGQSDACSTSRLSASKTCERTLTPPMPIGRKAHLHDGQSRVAFGTTDQLFKADEYQPLVVAYRNGAAVRLSDVATVDGFRGRHPHARPRQRQTRRSRSSSSASPARTSSPRSIACAHCCRSFAAVDPCRRSTLTVVLDRTTTIRASVHDVEITLWFAIVLVILVVFVFLRNVRSTLIPSVAVPVSLIGTFGVMYLLRLQPRQPVADGPDYRHRLCRGRCHRGDRKHHAPPRRRNAPDARRRCRAPRKSALPCSPSAFRWSRCSFRSC